MLKLIVTSICMLTSIAVFASHGKTFEIEEDSMLSELGGEVPPVLKEIQQEQLDEVIEYINTPTPVAGLREAKKYKAFYYDPIYQAKRDITSMNGDVIAKKGEIINPLDNIQTLQDLIFFDGMNLKHIEWAKTHREAKWILIKGSPLDIEDRTNHDTFFDQMGRLTTQFGIECIPAKVSKEGQRILIEEIPCTD